MLGKHSNERITNANYWKTIAMGSAPIDMGGIAQQFGQGQLLKNGRGDELESDALGVLFYDKSRLQSRRIN